MDFAQQEVGLEGNDNDNANESDFDYDDPVDQHNRNIEHVIESVVLGADDCPLPNKDSRTSPKRFGTLWRDMNLSEKCLLVSLDLQYQLIVPEHISVLF